jgi:hypothetical protein
VNINHGSGFSTYGTGIMYWDGRFSEWAIFFVIGLVLGLAIIFWWRG